MKEDLEETTPVYAALCMLMQRSDTAQRLANYIPAMLQVSTVQRSHGLHILHTARRILLYNVCQHMGLAQVSTPRELQACVSYSSKLLACLPEVVANIA